MYDGIKQAIGAMQSRIAPLRSATGDAIKDKSKQMERWVEHYSKLYSRVNVVSDEALMAMESLSIMDSWMSLIARQHWKTSTKLWTNSPPVRLPSQNQSA